MKPVTIQVVGGDARSRQEFRHSLRTACDIEMALGAKAVAPERHTFHGGPLSELIMELIDQPHELLSQILADNRRVGAATLRGGERGVDASTPMQGVTMTGVTGQ